MSASPAKNIRSRLTGISHGIPSLVKTNKDFEKIVETSDEWIVTRTGIRERRFIDREKGESLSGLAIESSKKALAQAKLSPSEISLVICCTTTPDTFIPNTASRIVDGIGATPAGAMDLGGACSGFVMGLHTADAFIRSGMHKNVLVASGDALSTCVDMSDRSTCVLFGDAMGACVLQAVEVNDSRQESHIIDSKICSLMDRDEQLSVKGGGSRRPFFMIDMKDPNEQKPFLTMNGQEVFKLATKSMANSAKEILDKNGYKLSDVKWLVPHQANLRIIEMVARLLDFPMEKVFVNVDRWGNTSAGTVPVALSEMNEQGLLKKGDLILLDVFGGGYSYGATLLRW